MSEFGLAGARIFVAGHLGMVGNAITRRLRTAGSIVLSEPRSKLDLRRQADVEEWMKRNEPDAVIVAAAKVGGIQANQLYPAEFIYDNLAIEISLIHAAHLIGIRKLLFLGSSCIYPKEAPQPICEESLLTGPLEPTNEWYAVAKIAGIKLCQAYRRQFGRDFISAMPCNLYGPNDNFHATDSHVVPALIRRFHEVTMSGADEVVCWGSGRPRREFLHVDDLAEACVMLLQHYSGGEHINIGTGTDISIWDLAHMVARVTGFRGRISWDATKSDGTMVKRLATGRIEAMGWRPSIQLEQGLTETYRWFLNAQAVRGT